MATDGCNMVWLENFLSDRTQQVVLDGCCSDILPVTSGVPRGTVLTPLLFLCYINDLPELVSCCCRLYADDVLLYKVIRLDEDCASLQSDLDVLQKWADDWQMIWPVLFVMNMALLVLPSSWRISPGQHYNKEELALKELCYTRS